LVNPLVLEVVRSVAPVEPLPFRLVPVRPVLLVALAHQEPDALLAAILGDQCYDF
jgi:hypothetical protein